VQRFYLSKSAIEFGPFVRLSLNIVSLAVFKGLVLRGCASPQNACAFSTAGRRTSQKQRIIIAASPEVPAFHLVFATVIASRTKSTKVSGRYHAQTRSCHSEAFLVWHFDMQVMRSTIWQILNKSEKSFASAVTISLLSSE
jgi:hypothetical protein